MEGKGSSMLPSLNGLRAFEAAASHMSFTRAADETARDADNDQSSDPSPQGAVRQALLRTRQPRASPDPGRRELPAAVRATFEYLCRATARLHRPDRERLLTVCTTASPATKWLVTRVANSLTGRISRNRGHDFDFDASRRFSNAKRRTWRCATVAATGPACGRPGPWSATRTKIGVSPRQIATPSRLVPRAWSWPQPSRLCQSPL
jgi:hypothetical protein